MKRKSHIIIPFIIIFVLMFVVIFYYHRSTSSGKLETEPLKSTKVMELMLHNTMEFDYAKMQEWSTDNALRELYEGGYVYYYRKLTSEGAESQDDITSIVDIWIYETNKFDEIYEDSMWSKYDKNIFAEYRFRYGNIRLKIQLFGGKLELINQKLLSIMKDLEKMRP